jgi:hypothetical protein
MRSSTLGPVASRKVTTTGVIRWWAGNALIYLAVTDDVVTYCWPPYAEHPPYTRHQYTGADARAVWRHAVRSGAQPNVDILWLPGVEKVDTLRMYGKRTVARWAYHGDIPALNGHLYLGRLPDGRWWTSYTGDGIEWAYPDEQAARVECERLLAVEPDRWSVAPIADPPRP